MSTAVSVALTVDAVEEHLVVSFSDPLFRVRDVERGTEAETDSVSLVARLAGLFDEPGPAFLALIDHDNHALDIGFVARRYRKQWSDITCPQQPRPILWQDVESELWACLTRLVTTRRASTESPS